jgi:hypothetical protein
MRKKPMNNNYGHKRRFDNNHRSGGGGHSNHRSGGSGGPRKNWPAMRERYMTQARDAMASGDRVLAENFLQHADHCWRMMMEEGSHRPRPQQPAQGQPVDGAAPQTAIPEETQMPENTNVLPAFITTPYGQPQQPQSAPPVQNWEERDAE